MGAIVRNKTIQTQNRFHRRSRYSRNRHRLREIEKTIGDRHGIVPETDDADIYLIAAATCFVRIARENGKRPAREPFAFWCEKWAPHVDEDEPADIFDQASSHSPLRTDDDWGRLLRVSDAERTRQRHTTIGGYDFDRKSRLKRSRANKRERGRLHAAEKRRAKGAIPRAQYLAGSLSCTKPWEKFGISRSTFERRRKAGIAFDASPSPHPLTGNGRRTCVKPDSQARTTTPDESLATKPTDVGTPTQKSIELARVDRAAGVGNPNRQSRPLKTRFPTSMRLSRDLKAYAVAAGYEPEKIQRMFETFGYHNLAIGSYSRDWTAVWLNWVDREVDIMNERHDRDRRRAYYERRWAA